MNTKRIYAGLIDYLITCVIQAFLFAIFFVKPLLDNNEGTTIFTIMVRLLVITFCSTSYLIIRDTIGKRSPGKRIIRLKIVDKNTGNEANFVKRFVRNITWLLGPIEIIMSLAADERLGDKLAKTNVVSGATGETT